MRLGLIGCGWIIERGHLPAIDLASGGAGWFSSSNGRPADVKVVAVADVSLERAKRIAKTLGLTNSDAYDDYRRLLARPDVDTVSVATPSNTHPKAGIWSWSTSSRWRQEARCIRTPTKRGSSITACLDARS